MGKVAFEAGAPGVFVERFPTIVLWMNGQTKRTQAPGSGRASNTKTGDPEFVLLRWRDHPQEAFFTTVDDFGLEFVEANDVATDAANADGAPVASESNGVFFKLTVPGLYRFSGAFHSGTLANAQQVRIYKVLSGDDELLCESSVEHTSAAEHVGSPVSVGINEIATTPPIEVAASDIMYSMEGETRNAASVSRGGYLEIEYLGVDES